MTLETGMRLGPYEIVAPLGAGGMGEVYRARDTRLEREVALKIVAGRHGDDPEALRRFAREARIAAQLTHPNVCTLYDAGCEGDVAYFVMELLEGETLAARIDRGPLPEPEVRRVAAGIARGLARAHELGFVHRDLKPLNVFLTSEGPKILDFGLARTAPAGGAGLSRVDTASALTGAGSTLGTVGYMSPEQVRGEPAGPASDVWAFGCVLYEMLAGRRAFAGRSGTETLAAVLTGAPDWSALAPDTPADLRDLAARCLDKDPGKRPKDVAAAGRALASGPGPLPAPETAPPPAAPSRPAPPRASRRLRAALAGGMLLAAAAAAVALYATRRASAPIDSLAVLPFSSTGSDAEVADLCASLSDSVISRVSEAPNLRVMASGAVARFAGPGVDPLPAPSRPAPPRASRRLRAAIAGGVLLAAAAAAALYATRRASAPIESLAVLPFSSTGSDTEVADLCASLSDSVISRVSEAPNLRVMASSAVARFAGPGVDPLAAARELNVQAVLTGRAVGKSGRVSISVELVDARDGRHLWGEQYERPLDGIAPLPAEIASAVTARLHLSLSGEDRARLARKETESRTAYELWLKGHQLAGRRTEADLSQALDDFQKAVDADPQFARAWAGIAEVWEVSGYTGRRPTPDAYERAKAAARRALALDPDLADAHAVLAHATMMTGDDRTAEAEFRRALKLDANSVMALHWYSHLLMNQKRWDESLALSKRLLEIDPMGFWNVHLGEHYLKKGDRTLALEQFRRAVNLDPNLPNARYELGHFFLVEGRPEDAVPQLEAACRLDPESPNYRRTLADAYEKAGRPADAARLRAEAGGPKP